MKARYASIKDTGKVQVGIRNFIHWLLFSKGAMRSEGSLTFNEVNRSPRKVYYSANT
jgi:hypothetical protein